jgi:hypothetical protein
LAQEASTLRQNTYSETTLDSDLTISGGQVQYTGWSKSEFVNNPTDRWMMIPMVHERENKSNERESEQCMAVLYATWNEVTSVPSIAIDSKGWITTQPYKR